MATARDRRIRLPQKAPDRIELVRVLRANPSAAARVWPRRRRGVRRGRRRRPSDRTPPGRLSGRATGRAPGRAGPGAVRRADLAWAALPAARHRPATPPADWASARAGDRLRWVPRQAPGSQSEPSRVSGGSLFSSRSWRAESCPGSQRSSHLHWSRRWARPPVLPGDCHGRTEEPSRPRGPPGHRAEPTYVLGRTEPTP